MPTQVNIAPSQAVDIFLSGQVRELIIFVWNILELASIVSPTYIRIPKHSITCYATGIDVIWDVTPILFLQKRE
jgi:hypothetical protein